MQKARSPQERRERSRVVDRKIRQLVTGVSFEPRLSKIYLSNLCEVPDRVKQFPELVQATWLRAFNNWLKLSDGDVGVAMKSANRSADTKLRQLKQQQTRQVADGRRRERSGEAGDLKRYTLKRLRQGPTVSIVVP